MKKLFSFVCALVCAMSLNAAKTIYLNTGGSSLWEQHGAVFMEGISNKDMTAVEGAFGYYQVSVDDSQTKVKFLRMKEDKSEQWNATPELTIPTDGNDCYTITGWGDKDGGWSKYTTPDPIDPSSIIYSIKHPWGGGTWSYKDLTPNEDGTYSIRDIYGGEGCNWKSTVSREKWVGTPTLVGEPAVGDSAIFTLTSTEGDGAITITKIASTGGEGGEVITLPVITLFGTMNDWKGVELVAAKDNLTASVSVDLAENTTYTFKITKDGGWLGNNGTMTADNCSGWTFTSNEGDCGLTTADAGSYTFKWEYATDKLSVIYPDNSGEGGNTDPSVTEYWYFDENNTEWNGTIDNKWQMTVSGDIAYVKVPAGGANKFKIFPCNPKVDDKVLANDDNIAEGALAGDIPLSKDTEQWKNILIDETSSEYFVVLYLPNTATNSSSKYLVAAKTQLSNSGSTPTALTNTEAENSTVKVIRNGQVLIVREGVTYNMMGQVIQ